MLDYATGAGDGRVRHRPGRRDRGGRPTSNPGLLEEGERLAAELGLVNVAFTLVDLYALPYGDGAFDLIVCRNAFHSLSEPGGGSGRT